MGEDETIEDYINDIVQEDFQNNIFPIWDKEQIAKLK